MRRKARMGWRRKLAQFWWRSDGFIVSLPQLLWFCRLLFTWMVVIGWGKFLGRKCKQRIFLKKFNLQKILKLKKFLTFSSIF
jgi:hypothetical protein